MSKTSDLFYLCPLLHFGSVTIHCVCVCVCSGEDINSAVALKGQRYFMAQQELQRVIDIRGAALSYRLMRLRVCVLDYAHAQNDAA